MTGTLIQFECDESDDPAFVALARHALSGTAALTRAQLLHIVKVDAWFGDRWYWFSGKMFGIAGMRRRRLTVPPFHPHRVVRESRFRVADGSSVAFKKPLHTSRTSQSNLSNYLERLGDSIAVGWYSGATKESGRGSIMAYHMTAEGPGAWHAGLERVGEEWQVRKLVGIDGRAWAKLSGVERAISQAH